MPRDIPVGNGQLLVCFDQHYRIRDLYFPHVGQENHAGGGAFRFGVYGDLKPDTSKDGKERRKRRLAWSDDGWTLDLRYRPDTLATQVVMRHEQLQLELRCTDVVDFHRPVLVREIEVHNLADRERTIKLVHHHDLQMYGNRVGDTAYYDPQLRALVHYRANRYVYTCFFKDGEPLTEKYATGTAGFGGAEGTWRDAEDGKLGQNPIAQGAVDSTMLLELKLPAKGTDRAHMVIGCGKTYDDCEALQNFVRETKPKEVIERTMAYWRLWLAASRTDFDTPEVTGVSDTCTDLFKRSLLMVRTQIDNQGAIIAANDSDYLQYSRDTYSYLWPRDGAFVADAMDAAGFPDLSRSFYRFCAERCITSRGLFLHKYNPDGSPASSWHPWVDQKGRPRLPIQEDETALVIWALWRHYVRYRDIEFVRPLWVKLVQPAADFMLRYRNPDTRLPLPSYDLWEERYGVHAFTVASVYAGLKAAWQFAVCFGDGHRARRYACGADEVQHAFKKHFWSDKLGRYLRRIENKDYDRISELIAEVYENRTPGETGSDEPQDGLEPGVFCELPPAGDHAEFHHDEVLDASMFSIVSLGLLPVTDERVDATMQAIEDRLTVKTEVGGVARYEDDTYHQTIQDTDRVPGNPWFICTLWLADWYITKAQTVEDLKPAAKIMQWVADRALPSGVLAEQVHPETNQPLSVSPLTWSHATVVATTVNYFNKLEHLKGDSAKSGSVASENTALMNSKVRTPVLTSVPELPKT